MRKVKITKLPKAEGGGSSSIKKTFGKQTPPQDASSNPAMGAFSGGTTPEIKINKTLQPTDKKNATLEAELGETVVTNLQQEDIPEFYKIGGKRHYNGGTPLNLPPNSFIFSRDKRMEVKDPDMLDFFGKSGKKKSYSPAELSKQYDINHYREILVNPFSDKMQIKTAELMIKNYNNKLGALALTQESIKGFDNGIPDIAMSYLDTMQIDPSQFITSETNPSEGMSQQPMPQMQQGAPQAAPAFKGGGQLKRFQGGGPTYGMNEAYGPKGAKRLNMMRHKYGLPQLKGKIDKAEMKKAAGELQAKIAEVHPQLLADYMTNVSHQPNEKLIGMLNERGMLKKGEKPTTALVKELYEKGDLNLADIQEGYSDNQWWYRALDTNLKELTQEEYDKKMASGKGLTQGEKTFFHDDPTNPELYTEYIVKNPEAPIEAKPKDELDIEHMGPGVTDNKDTPFWMQDMNNVAADLAGMLSLKKHRPWNAPIDSQRVNPQFVDFRQAAANINSGMASAANQASMMGNPQAHAANMAASQRNATQGIANVQDAEFKTNVGIANQFAQYNNQVSNQNAAMQAQNATNLHDKNAIMNQQFDNAKAAYRDNLRANINQAFTNRGQTDTMNKLQPNYDIDPSDGGTMHFVPGYDRLKASKNPASISDEYQNLITSTGDKDAALKLMEIKYGKKYTGLPSGYNVGPGQ